MELVITPQCKFCSKTYSELNEPIYTVCTCEATPKFAHGSCFRNWLKIYKYSVCEVCLSKSIIVRNGYKSFKEWRLPQYTAKSIYAHLILLLIIAIVFACYTTWWLIAQCWQLKCYIIVIVLFVLLKILVVSCFYLKETRYFFINIRRDNSYWKVTQCKEVIGRKENKSVRRLSDVPTIQRPDVKTGLNFFKENTNGEAHLNLDDDFHSFSPHNFLEENMSNIRTPRDYPHIKKVVEYKKRDISKVLTDNDKNVPELNLEKTNSFNADNEIKLQVFDDSINIIHSNNNCNEEGPLKNDKLTNVKSVNRKSLYDHLTTKLGRVFTEPPVVNLSQEAVMPFETDIAFKTQETSVTPQKPEIYIKDHNIKQFEKNVYKQTKPFEYNSVETEIQKRVSVNSLTVYNGPQEKYYLYEENHNVFPRLSKGEESHNTSPRLSKNKNFKSFFSEPRAGQNNSQEEVSSQTKVSNEVKQIFI